MLLKKMKKTFLIISALTVMCGVTQSVSANGEIASIDAYLGSDINDRKLMNYTGIVFQNNPTLTVWAADDANEFMGTAAVIAEAFQHGGIGVVTHSSGGYEYVNNMSLGGNTNGVTGSVSGILFLTGANNKHTRGVPWAYAEVNGPSNGFFIVTKEQAMVASLSLVQNRPVSFTTGTYSVYDGVNLPYAIEGLAASVILN